MGTTIIARRGMATIYALYDPRDGQARYVGRTVRALQERLLDHIQYKAAPNPAKREWLEALLVAGMMPEIRELERVPAHDAAFAEARWIHTLQATGARLLNVNLPGGPGVAHDRELTAKEAAALLGCTDRSVRRWIAKGRLAGRVEGSGRDAIYRTSVMAVETFKALHGLPGAAGPATDTVDPMDWSGPVDSGDAVAGRRSASMDQRDDLVDTLVCHVERLARENGRLQAEVGRLEAELAQARAGHNGHNGQAAGPWARLVPWLRG